MIVRLGVDRAAAYALIGKGWVLISRPVTILLIASFMTQDYQGYYYTFNSILTLSIFVELGLGVVLTQFYSHEAAYLQTGPGGTLMGDPASASRLISILRQALRWYSVIGLITLVIVGSAGFLLFSGRESFGIDWQLQWAVFVLLNALRMPIQPFLSAVEGLGNIAQVQALRFTADFTGTLLLWATLYAGGKLLASWCLPLAEIILCSVFILWRYRSIARQAFSRIGLSTQVHWRTEIWPMQWRIALSWVSGFFSFQVFTPVLFRFQGPAVAGQMGMALAISSAAGIIPMAIVATKIPAFGKLIARKEYRALDSLFFRAAVVSFVLSAAAALVALGAVGIVATVPRYAGRILPTWELSGLLLAALISGVTASMAMYLRAHKREPLLWNSMTGGLLVGLGALLGGIWYSSTGQVASYLAVVALVGLPWTAQVFFRSRRVWHTPESNLVSDSSTEAAHGTM